MNYVEKNIQKYGIYVLAAYIGFLALVKGNYWFSPDSWSYFELSKTVFSGSFFEFNTYRSYLNDKYSASFPYFFPLIIAIFNEITFYEPSNAIFINYLLILITYFVLIKIDRKLNTNKVTSLYFLAVFLNPLYINEVLAGRSIPLAVFVLTISFYFFCQEKILYCGLFLGLAAATKFDLLLPTITLLIFFIYFKKDSRSHFLVVLGFFISVSPWIYYSYTRFDSFWMSDNIWVAKSAVNAFVLDYPAFSTQTIFSDPFVWFKKIIYNSLGVLKGSIKYIMTVPIAGALIFYIFKENSKSIKFHFLIFLIFMCLAISGMLMTGYFDQRYFVLPSIFLIYYSVFFYDFKLNNKIFLLIFFITLLGLIYKTVMPIIIDVDYNAGIEESNITLNENCYIDYLAEIQSDRKGSVILFSKDFNLFNKFKYGALTGNYSAVFPSNYDFMNSNERLNFMFSKDFLIINNEMLYGRGCE